MAFVFNGRALSAQIEEKLEHYVATLKLHGAGPKVLSFVFREDEASLLYTRLKKNAAHKIGIAYDAIEHSLADDLEGILSEIRKACANPLVTGVMVQKPSQGTWENSKNQNPNFKKMDFKFFWEMLVQAIDPKKDVDCLSPKNLKLIEEGKPFVVPATVRGVLTILKKAKEELQIDDHAWKAKKLAILGRSDIVGKPLYFLTKDKFAQVGFFGRDNFPQDLKEYDIVVAAVGRPNLVKAQMLKDGAVVVDVGSPKGDVDFDTAVYQASFITPVPGGVGPMTVMSLMENIVALAKQPNLL